MKNLDATAHVTGKSLFLDDLSLPGNTLHGAVFYSPIASGTIVSLNFSAAESAKGVAGVFTASSIPGINQIGGIISDEPLFAGKEVHFAGQPIAFVVAGSRREALRACKLIKAEFLPSDPVTAPRKAKEMGNLLFPPRTFRMGDVDTCWEKCAHVFRGTASTGAQEHLYLETQGACALPGENGRLTVYASTQGLSLVQKTVARVLGIPMHSVTVDVLRLGGGFGGKEDQATAWAVMTALAAYLLRRPVKLVLDRQEDIRITGKRHPYEADFTIGLTGDLKITGYEVTYYQNGGAAADLSPAILERTLFHSTNAYFIPNVRATAYSCRTNLPPNTAFRGFGAPQAMFILESAIDMAARSLGVPAHEIQEKNLIADGDSFPYGQVLRDAHAKAAWEDACRTYNLQGILQETDRFNRENKLFKKGVAVMPVCFGISFTNTRMNQGMALVHIYSDGSVGVSTGAVEMGQGVNTKMKQVAAALFSISPEKIRLETTNTSRTANSSPTAASTGADLNGKAVRNACESLLGRLLENGRKMLGGKEGIIRIENEKVLLDEIDTGIAWEKLVESAFFNRVSLSQSGHYATPVIHFDKSAEKGHPFAYHVFGAAIIRVTIDCLRGTYWTDSVQIVHDFGNNVNPEIDKGQVEGAVMQGIGWMTLEEIRYDETGRLLSDSLSTYKVPDVYSAPGVVECKALDAAGPELSLLGSKAVGEPPFVYGIGAYFALRNAIKAFNPGADPGYDAPLTPEKLLCALYSGNQS